MKYFVILFVLILPLLIQGISENNVYGHSISPPLQRIIVQDESFSTKEATIGQDKIMIKGTISNKQNQTFTVSSSLIVTKAGSIDAIQDVTKFFKIDSTLDKNHTISPNSQEDFILTITSLKAGKFHIHSHFPTIDGGHPLLFGPGQTVTVSPDKNYYMGNSTTTIRVEPSKQMQYKDDLLDITRDGKFLPPLNQMALGVSPDRVRCNSGLGPILKNDISPACVTPDTRESLIKRGWSANVIDTGDSKYPPPSNISQLNKLMKSKPDFTSDEERRESLRWLYDMYKARKSFFMDLYVSDLKERYSVGEPLIFTVTRAGFTDNLCTAPKLSITKQDSGKKVWKENYAVRCPRDNMLTARPLVSHTFSAANQDFPIIVESGNYLLEAKSVHNAFLQKEFTVVDEELYRYEIIYSKVSGWTSQTMKIDLHTGKTTFEGDEINTQGTIPENSTESIKEIIEEYDLLREPDTTTYHPKHPECADCFDHMIRINIGDDYSKWIAYQGTTSLMLDGHRQLIETIEEIYNDHRIN